MSTEEQEWTRIESKFRFPAKNYQRLQFIREHVAKLDLDNKFCGKQVEFHIRWMAIDGTLK